MKKSVLGSILAGVVATGACTQTPGAPSVSFSAPIASTPSTGSSFKYSQQPITLTLNNAVKTSPADATYVVEVASDAGFTNKVFTKDGIVENTGATTTVQVSQLAGATMYYWRSMTVVDGITGAPSPTRTFAVQQQVIVNIPGQSFPESDSVAVDPRPTFRVNNASRTGPAGSISYEFQVSTSSSFSPLTATATIGEQGGQTSWTPNADIPVGNYFWRVQAIDASNEVKSGFTGARAFRLEPFSLKNAVIHNNPPDIGSWEESAKIWKINFDDGRVVVDFDRREGPGRWVEVGFGDGGIQYTLGMCLFIEKQWHCSAAIQFWDGRELEAGGGMFEIGQEWYYDARWGIMAGYQPKFGEIVGIFALAGNQRDSGNIIQKERTNVVFIPYGTNYNR